MATVYFSQSLSVCSAEAVPPLITDLTVMLFKYNSCMYPICALCASDQKQSFRSLPEK